MRFIIGTFHPAEWVEGGPVSEAALSDRRPLPPCAAPVLSPRPRALLLAELEALVAEQELGAATVDLHELEVVVEGRARLDGVDPPVHLDVELLAVARDRDQPDVMAADHDLVRRALVPVAVTPAPATAGRGGRGRRRGRGRREGRGRWGGDGRRASATRNRRRAARARGRRGGGADAAARDGQAGWDREGIPRPGQGHG